MDQQQLVVAIDAHTISLCYPVFFYRQCSPRSFVVKILDNEQPFFLVFYSLYLSYVIGKYCKHKASNAFQFCKWKHIGTLNQPDGETARKNENIERD